METTHHVKRALASGTLKGTPNEVLQALGEVCYKAEINPARTPEVSHLESHATECGELLLVTAHYADRSASRFAYSIKNVAHFTI